MFYAKALLPLASVALATITITDPSDKIPSSDWETDNALLADYNIASVDYLLSSIKAAYKYDNTAANITHKSLSVNGNDTSVLVIANGSDVSVTYTDVLKYGYSSNLDQASFFGVNAAVNIANDSTATFDNVNITVHNGAANLYSYGTDTVVYVTNAWLYSSGPVSHGLYAAGNGTFYGSNIYHYSGGYRASSFSGDSPAGYIHVTDAVAHTDGIGSAICFALGLCNMTNVIGHASRSPTMFMDGDQTAIWKNCDLTAGLLGGIIMFSSSTRGSGGSVTYENSKLTVLGDTMPALWFGNTIATANVISSTLNNTASGIVAVANYSQVTQDFDYYADYSDNNDLLPAEATINVEESSITGDLVAYNGSSISLSLTSYSSWVGEAYSGYGDAYFAVSLDSTSNWTLTASTSLQNFTDSDTTLSNVFSNGYNITYNTSSSANSAWDGKTVSLTGGGYLVPSSS